MEKDFYTNIHCHMLFGVDDGAQTFEESKEMLKLARVEGIRSIIFTPHFIIGKAYDPDILRRHFHVLEDFCEREYGDMNLYLGNEILYSPGVIKALESEKALTLAGSKYVLIEFLTTEPYTIIYEGLRNLTEYGYMPILAHVERYEALYKNMERIEELIRLGAYMQVNCRSFLGGRVNRITAWVMHLMQNQYVHFIADDSHNVNARKPIMETTVKKLARKADPFLLDRMIYQNPNKVLDNQYIE